MPVLAIRGKYAINPGYVGSYLPMHQIPLDDVQYLTGLEAVIKQLAESRAVVIRGRGSQFILKDFPGALHILLIAPEIIRKSRIMVSLNLPESDAKKEISRSDNSHREFIRRYFLADLEDPLNYDMVVNTARLSFVDAAAALLKAISIKQRSSEQKDH